MAEKKNYYREMEKEIESFAGRKPGLLLHSCCGPCSTSTIETLAQHFNVTVIYYNPCIQPAEEYYLRLQNQMKVLEIMEIPILECSYDGECFSEVSEGYENEPEGGARCARCFAQRLEFTAKHACEGDFEYFCTTLTVSPHKNAALINSIGEAMSSKYGVKWLHSDFKKKNGYLRSIQISRELGLYRQDYCGCIYSKVGGSNE